MPRMQQNWFPNFCSTTILVNDDEGRRYEIGCRQWRLWKPRRLELPKNLIFAESRYEQINSLVQRKKFKQAQNRLSVEGTATSLFLVETMEWIELNHAKITDNAARSTVEQTMRRDNTMGKDTYNKSEYTAWRCGVVRGHDRWRVPKEVVLVE
jgi:hypothetical protein